MVHTVKIEKDGLHQFKKITVENGIGEATLMRCIVIFGNPTEEHIETGEYKAVLAIARRIHPNVEGQNQNNWDTNNAVRSR